MQTQLFFRQGRAQHLPWIEPNSVDLVLTSPPYPMIRMWDEVFREQDQEIGEDLKQGRGKAAFEKMHRLLDEAWRECDRVLRPGGILCLNIGDATRNFGGDFQLYSNHSRMLTTFIHLGYDLLPDILWRKQTNAPNKFLGSGMLPVGAYVTYEHEYILILRKGPRRFFASEEEQKRRRESAYFWEERNVWFSDVWQDIKGASQPLKNKLVRDRSGAFPFELAYRLICMYSLKGDLVLDPFAGTGTSLIAALATARNAIGVEIDSGLVAAGAELISKAENAVNAYNRQRLCRHIDFVKKRTTEQGPLKYSNIHYGFPVMTRQERELLLNPVLGCRHEGEGCFTALYDERPQNLAIKRERLQSYR